MGLIKIFSGSEVLANGLQSKIEAIAIKTIVKTNNQATKINNNSPVIEIFINEIDFGKISTVLEDFRMSI